MTRAVICPYCHKDEVALECVGATVYYRVVWDNDRLVLTDEIVDVNDDDSLQAYVCLECGRVIAGTLEDLQKEVSQGRRS